jgi:DNA-binding NtrC family response regulator
MTDRILIVDDETGLRRNIVSFLERRGYEAIGASSIHEARKLLEQLTVDVMLTDLKLGDGDGIELVNLIRDRELGTLVLLMTAYASVQSAIETFRSGACDYLIKPFPLKELGAKIENICRYRRLIRQNTYLRQQVQNEKANTRIIASSNIMVNMMSMVEKVAPTPSNVLIYGETGVGKELVAKRIHELSACRDELFVPLNLAAIPDTLMESHLFGHRRGAFTGADKEREGAFRAASGGTLLLDEIGEMPLHIQPKLLRALENREITPLGSDIPEQVNTRVLAATHRDLDVMARDGSFRQDLLMRLNMFSVRVPPLRERKDEIPLLAEYLLQRHCTAVGKSIHGIDNKAMSYLIGYDWIRGNVRELSNAIERAVILCDDEHIQTDDLPHDIVGVERSRPLLDLKTAVQKFEHGHIHAVLESVNGNREMAAEVLGISVATLYRHLARFESGHSSVCNA